MKKLLLLLVLLFQAVFAQSFNFNSAGENSANKILKDYVKNQYEIEDADTVGYFLDSNQVIGIIKSGIFYNLEGYKLMLLKKENDEYKPIKCDVFFDNTRDIVVNNGKITYYKSIFYKNKKYSEYIRNDSIKTYKTVNDKLTDRKVQSIERVTRHDSGISANNLELTDFKTLPQKNINVKYNNLSERTKHYLYMK